MKPIYGALCFCLISFQFGYADNLKEGVRRGLEKSPAVKQAIAEAKKRFHEIGEVRAGNKPQVLVTSGLGFATRDRSIEGVPIASGDPRFSRDIRLSVQQIVYDFGTNKLLTESAQLRNEFQKLLIHEVEEQQAALIADTYLEVYKNRLLSKILQDYIVDINSLLSDARTLEEVEGTEEILLLEGRVTSAKSRLSEVVSRIKGMNGRFKLLTTMNADGPVQLSRIPTRISSHVSVSESPKYKAADLAIKVSQTNIMASKKDKLPKVFFQADTGIGQDVGGIRGGDNEWGALLALSWKPIDGGKKDAIVAQNIAELEKDFAAKNEVIQSINDSVVVNQAQLDGAIQKRTQLIQAQKKLESAIAVYKEKMEAEDETVTLFGLSNHYKEALSLELEAAEALIDSYQSAIYGMHSSGGLLKYFGIQSRCKSFGPPSIEVKPK